MKAHINTYNKGINKDRAPAKYSNDQYYDARNFRVVVDKEGSSNSSRISREGNSLLFSIPNTLLIQVLEGNNFSDIKLEFKINGDSSLITVANNINLDTSDYNKLEEDLNNALESSVFNLKASINKIGGYIYLYDPTGENTVDYFRIIDNNTSNSISNAIYPTSNHIQNNLSLVGYNTSREYCALITCNNNITAIWLWDSNSPNTVDLKYVGDLSLPNKTNVYSKLYYENTDNLKLYFGNEHTFMKGINLFNTDLMSYTEGEFNLVRDFKGSNINITEKVSGGNFKAGVVQYAYKLYTIYDKESYVSPVSDLISIDDNTSLGNDTAEGINITILGEINNLDTRFTHIKIYRLHYTQPGVNPSVDVVIDSQFNSKFSKLNNGSIKFSDDGQQTLGVETLDKIRLLSKDNFKAYDIESKDNRLFAGNIEKEIFDVEYDTRAYTFEEDSTNLKLFQKDNTENNYTITNGSLGSSDWDVIPEDHDCISPEFWDSNGGGTNNGFEVKGRVYNQFFDANYKHNSSIKGGSGKNVSYEFKRVHPDTPEVLAIDSITDFAETSQVRNLNSPTYDDGTEKNFKNSLLLDLRGYQEGEVYRFGIRFKNKYGKYTPAKWIADILIPVDSDPNYVNHNNTSKEVEIYPTYVEFKINITQELLNQGVEGFEILRAERKEKDKTVLANGLITYSVKNEGSTRPSLHPVPDLFNNTLANWLDTYTNGDNKLLLELGTGQAVQKHTDVINFYSPEVSFNPNFDANGCELVLTSTLKDFYSGSGTNNSRQYRKFYRGIVARPLSENCYIKISQSERVTSSLSPTTASQNSVYINDLNWPFKNFVPNAITGTVNNNISLRGGMGGTSLVIKSEDTREQVINKIRDEYNSQFLESSGQPFAKLIKRLSAQYGGNNYEARSYTTYIPVSNYINVSNVGIKTATSKRGDIFIGSYELYRKMVFFSDNTSNKPNGSNTAGFDSYNNICFSHIPSTTTINIDKKSSKGFWTGLDGVTHLREFEEQFDTLTQIDPRFKSAEVKDAFDINRVYNKQNNEVFSSPLPFKYNPITKFDSLVKWSDFKSENELVDSWTEFRLNNEYQNLDNDAGALTGLVKLSGQIFFSQERGFGMLLINPRYTQSSAEGIEISIGKGDTLADHKYYTNVNGCNHRMAICAGNRSILWYDNYNKTLMQFAGKIKELSIEKEVQSFFLKYNDVINRPVNTNKDNPLKNQGVSITYNDDDKSFLINTKGILRIEQVPNFSSGSGPSFTEKTVYYKDNLEYSERYDIITGSFDFLPDFAININNYYITANNDNSSLWYHNDSANISNYYGEQYDNTITFIINPNQSLISIFDILDYKCNVLEKVISSTTSDFDQYEDREITFGKVRFSNDYQNSGWIDVDAERLFRAWRINEIFDGDGETRMRDVYLKVEFKFENNGKYKMLLSDLITKYRNSQY